MKFLMFLVFPILISFQKNSTNLNKLSYDEIWLTFFKKYRTNSNPIKYAEAYLNKAKKENSDLEIGRGLYLYAFNYLEKNNEKAISYFWKSLDYAKRSNDNSMITTIYFDIAGIKCQQFKYKEAVDNFILAEKFNQDPDYTYIIKLNIAVIKSENLGEIDEALNLYKKCFNYYRKKGTRLPQYKGFYQEILFDIADAFKAKKVVDSATYYNKLGYIEAKYSKNEEMLNLFILNEGANQVANKNYKIALDSVTKALPIMKKYKNTGNTLASYYYLGKIYERTGNVDLAVLNYKKVDSIYKVSKQIIPEFVSGYNFLINYYKNKGDKTNQLLYLNTYLTIDSEIQKNYKLIYKKIQREYEIPNLIKEKEALISDLKGNQLYYIVGLVVLLFGVFSLGYYQFYLKKQYRIRFENIMAIDIEKNKLINNEKPIEELNSEKNIGISNEIITEILEKLKQFELDNGFLNSNITIQILSDRFNTNSKYLSQIINKFKNKSFINYINELRIEYAIIKLKQDKILRKYSLLALTKEFGFNSSESFSTAFYKKTAIKPLYFIKEIENDNPLKSDV